MYNINGEEMINIYDFTYEKLVNYLIENNEKKFRATQIFDWLYKKKVDSFDLMANLNDSTLKLLKETTYFGKLGVEVESVSVDGTVKYLFRLEDDNLIETVVMSHNYGFSVCVTSQVGCNMGCKFCASGLLKKKRNLSTGEMVQQILMAEKLFEKRISHVVVMGIGEPFDNYDNLMDFLKNINDHRALEIGARHITVSTCGIVPKIKEYANEQLQINLAISLHAPNDEIRNKIMPINKAYPVNEVIDAIKYYMTKTNRRITIEYILIKGLNDQKEHALELAQLLKGLNVYVNLIPYNVVFEQPYERSQRETMDIFFQTLIKNKINATLRKEQGHDINAACGQLRSKHEGDKA